MERVDIDGRVKCPRCGNRLQEKLLPQTYAEDMVLYCKRCKHEHVADVHDGAVYFKGQPRKTPTKLDARELYLQGIMPCGEVRVREVKMQEKSRENAEDGKILLSCPQTKMQVEGEPSEAWYAMGGICAKCMKSK